MIEDLISDGTLVSTLAKKDACSLSLFVQTGLVRSRDNDGMRLIHPKWDEFRPNKAQFGAKHGKVEEELGHSLRKLARLQNDLAPTDACGQQRERR
jgi:hypothetical protein